MCITYKIKGIKYNNIANNFIFYAFCIYNFRSFNNESTSTSKNQSKMLMKENRDPHANHVTKMFDHLA